MARKKYRPWDKDKTDLENADLKGKIKQVMQITYKAHQQAGTVIQDKIEREYSANDSNFIATYNEKGRKIRMQNYGTDGCKDHCFNNKGWQTGQIEYKRDGTLDKTHVNSYNEKGGMYASHVTNADGSLYYRTTQSFDKDGKMLEHFHYMGTEERIIGHNIREYDERGNQISVTSYEADGTVKNLTSIKFDEHGKEIESKTEYFEDNMRPYGRRTIHKRNEYGDTIETIVFDYKGNVKDTYSYNHYYDSEGKKIITPHDFDDDEDNVKNETEETENDAHDNWIKKTTFYNKIPVNIIVRHISYYGEPSASEPAFEHPVMNETLAEDKQEVREEFTVEEAKWLVDYPNAQSESYNALRYYALRYKELPSVRNYSGPYIEAHALLKELKENKNAIELHSYESQHGNHDTYLSRYTLAFNGYAYILQSSGIGSQNADEFEVPDNLLGYTLGDGFVHTSSFTLLRPSEASAKRDEYFEHELEEYISLCSLSKKPDKPVINMIEVKGGSYSMVEHALDDDFEIKDLDVNYGYGFEKFHNDLMHRFNTSTKGLVLFHGQPGTGKTFYIRHLLRKMSSNKKVVIYMPPNMVDHLIDPSFMTFLSGEVQDWSANGNFCVLLIEDAEPLLAKRQEGVRIQGVTNLLNMTDGLLNDMLNLQIICTFNVDLRKLDSALLRPGRLIARKEFKALSELDANLLAQRLGIKHHFKKPATLGEIYAKRKNQTTLIHDVEPDRDASTNIDDLL